MPGPTQHARPTGTASQARHAETVGGSPGKAGEPHTVAESQQLGKAQEKEMALADQGERNAIEYDLRYGITEAPKAANYPVYDPEQDHWQDSES